jgi:protein-tyrosine phosphatase
VTIGAPCGPEAARGAKPPARADTAFARCPAIDGSHDEDPRALTEIARTLLPRLEPGESLGVALGMAAAFNLRDVGGYRTADGATVAVGLAYRSDRLHAPDPEDRRKLARLGIRSCYDLRTAAEADARPADIPPGAAYFRLNVLADAESAVPAALENLLRNPVTANAALDIERIDALYLEGYRQFVSLPSARQSYRALFLALADRDRLPGVFHCTAGKDRTGWAAAALLTLLGVPRETVVADFLRSNDHVVPRYQRAIDAFAAGGGDPAIPRAVLGVKREYLAASFTEMEERFGAIEDYFAAGLGIDTADQQALRARFLE